MSDEGFATEIEIRTHLIDQLPQIENTPEMSSFASEVPMVFKWESKSEVQTDKDSPARREFSAKPVGNRGTGPTRSMFWTKEFRRRSPFAAFSYSNAIVFVCCAGPINPDERVEFWKGFQGAIADTQDGLIPLSTNDNLNVCNVSRADADRNRVRRRPFDIPHQSNSGASLKHLREREGPIGIHRALLRQVECSRQTHSSISSLWRQAHDATTDCDPGHRHRLFQRDSEFLGCVRHVDFKRSLTQIR